MRRRVRKTNVTRRTFDEAQWPIDAALVTVGAFLLGTALSFLRFDEPRWYLNAWTCVVGVPLFIGVGMYATRRISHSWLRRSMQFGMLISLLAHLIFLLIAVDIYFPGKIFSRKPVAKDFVREQQRQTIPDYSSFELAHQTPETPDFERPVETETPTPAEDVVEPERTEVDQAPIEPQPQPVPQPEETVRPSIVRRNEAYESVPRRSEQASRLSRNMEQVRSSANETPQVAMANATAASSPAALQPQPQAIHKQSAEAPRERADTEDSVATAQATDARRMVPAEPTPNQPRSPLTIRRENALSRVEPSLAVPTRPVSPSRSPDAPVLTPAAVDVTQLQQSPASQGQPAEAPQEAAELATQAERRQNNLDQNPVAAQTPQTLPTRQPRMTERPHVAPVPQVADVVSNATSTTPIAPASTQAARSTPLPAEPQITASPTPQPQSERSATARATSTADSSDSSPATSLARNATAPQWNAATPAPAAPTASTQASTTPAVTAASVDVARQAAGGSVTPTTAQFAESSAAADPSPTPGTARAQANHAASGAATASPAIPRQMASNEAARNVATTAERITASSAPQRSEQGLRPSQSDVARQTPMAGTSVSAQPVATPQLSATQQVARLPSQRPLAADTPTLAPQDRPTSLPARSTTTATVAQSPVSLPSPASQVSEQAAPTAVQPSPTAYSRGTTGTAGSGYSANLDRMAPSSQSPSLVASGSSRQRATQDAPEGPALSPSARAQVARARAAEPRPSGAETTPGILVGPLPSSERSDGPPSSASAAETTLAARADQGDVTADQGTLQVDLGPERTVAQLQSGRASGGGQPQVTFATTNATTPAPRNGAALASLDVDTRAPSVAAPAGDGGSRPLAIDANPAATSAQRTDPGGTAGTSGGPTAETLAGPVSEASDADLIGPLAARTSTTTDPSDAGADPGGTPGGGAGTPLAARSRNATAPATASVSAAAEAVANGQASGGGEPGTAVNQLAPLDTSTAPGARRQNNELTAAPGIDGAALSATLSDRGAVAAMATPSRRAEASQAPIGAPVIGGGRDAQPRAARASEIAPSIAGIAVDSPSELGNPATARAAATPTASGLNVQRRDDGTISVARADDGQAMTAGVLISNQSLGPVRAAGTQGTEPAVATTSVPSVGRQRGGVAPASLAATQLPSANPGAPPGSGEPSADLAPPDVLASGPRSTGVAISVPVNIEAAPGDGGLAAIPMSDVGIDDLRARSDSEQIQSRAARLPRRDVGGRPQMNTAPVVATEAFRKRVERNSNRPGGDRLGPETEQAIEMGLAFLAQHQHDDGRWSLQGIDDERPAFQSDTAATALALLAFQGAGYTHQEHRYADNVRRGIEYLVANQNREGLIYALADEESNRFAQLYSHGIAALALCEAYGMTQDSSLRDPAQRAVDFIVATQSDELGGWRYTPNTSSDTSVTGWMMMAMKSGELANLEVPAKAYQGVVRWLDISQNSADEPHLYRYNPFAPDTPTQRHGLQHSRAMTSVGLLMRLYTGWKRDHATMRRGADYLAQNLPAMGRPGEPLTEQKRDTYYWYYATQVMFHMGGDYWRDWNGRLHPLLVQTQIQAGPLAGSWDPVYPVPDRWAPQAGRLYVTALNLLSLEVHYRHLPLYDDTAK
jgi:hypothetical protein